MSSFLCPLCGGETGVLDSRPAAIDRPGIRRRRRCAVCHNRFTTYEQTSGNGGAGNFTTQLDDLPKQAEALVAQSEALMRATAHLQYLSTAWREIEDGRQQFTTIKAEDWKP